MDVKALPLCPITRSKLEVAGYNTINDFEGVGPVELSRDANLTHDEALVVIRSISRPTFSGPSSASADGPLHGGAHLHGSISALDLLQQEQARRPIITLCAELDALMGGGVATLEVTEFCGPPGVGKTQLGIQLSCAVQLPASLGGLEGEAVYIDTEGSFMVERCAEVAGATARHARHLLTQHAAAAASGDDGPAAAAALARAAEGLTTEALLARIHYFRVHNASEQRAVVEAMPSFMDARPAVKLLIIDSVAFHYRQDFEDMYLRTRLLGQMSVDLMRLADAHGLAVVSMNQVTTKVSASGVAELVPALGESFAHSCTTRVTLSWQGDVRTARLYKSPRLPPGTAPYAVTSDGIRSVRPLKRGLSGHSDQQGQWQGQGQAQHGNRQGGQWQGQHGQQGQWQGQQGAGQQHYGQQAQYRGQEQGHGWEQGGQQGEHGQHARQGHLQQ